MSFDVSSSALTYLDLKDLRTTQNAYCSLLTHTKQLLLEKFCDTLAILNLVFGQTEPRNRNHGTRTTEPDGQTDVEVEIVI